MASNGDNARAETLIGEMVGQTRQLVERQWPEIEALAQRLLMQGTVNFLRGEEHDTSVPASD